MAHMGENKIEGIPVFNDERRRNRSPYRYEAMGLQLAYVRKKLGLSAIVLCDDLGQVVASDGNLEEVENRRLTVQSANIETEKQTENRASLERMETQIRQIQSSIKTFAILLPPVPVFALGVWTFVRRQRREREGAAAARRLRE